MFKQSSWDDQAREYVVRECGVGATLYAKIDTNYRIMSDVYGCATNVFYWDTKTNQPRHAVVDVVEGIYHKVNPEFVVVDATEDIREKYREYLIDLELKRQRAETRASNVEIKKGTLVKVMKGKLVPIGTVARIVGTFESQYGTKIGLAMSDEMIEVTKNGKTFQNHKDVSWTYLKNVVAVEQVEVDELELYETAAKIVDAKIREQDKLHV